MTLKTFHFFTNKKIGFTPFRNQKLLTGFTLVETIVAIFVFTLILGALFGFITMAYRTYGYTWERSLAINEARRGIEIMVKEIREAKSGDNGSFAIEKADDKQFIFYSDIDNDGKTERVRYFLGSINSGSQTQECVSFVRGGTCNVTFSNFLQGTIVSAQLRVSIEGDLGAGNEYAEIFADGIKLANLCQTGCSDCAGTWQGINVFDVTSQTGDDFVQFLADATNQVDPNCNWQDSNHSIKVRFELSWTEEIIGAGYELKKGIIKPTAPPVQYPLEQETFSLLSSYVRNAPPIFEYFDSQGNRITESPARLVDTKLMQIFLIVNIDPNRPPQDFELKSSVQLRNLKEE